MTRTSVANERESADISESGSAAKNCNSPDVADTSATTNRDSSDILSESSSAAKNCSSPDAADTSVSTNKDSSDILSERGSSAAVRNHSPLIKFYGLPVAALCGLLGGGACVLFYACTQICDQARIHHEQLLYLLPVAGLLIVFLYDGILGERDLSLGALFRHAQEGKPVSLWIAPMIFLSTCLAYLTGGSVGRAGSALQIGGSIAANLRHRDSRYEAANSATVSNPEHIINRSEGRFEDNLLVACGMSAGFTAILNSPLAGAVFGVEILVFSRHSRRLILPALLSSFLTWGIALGAGYLLAAVSDYGAAVSGIAAASGVAGASGSAASCTAAVSGAAGALGAGSATDLAVTTSGAATASGSAAASCTAAVSGAAGALGAGSSTGLAVTASGAAASGSAVGVSGTAVAASSAAIAAPGTGGGGVPAFALSYMDLSVPAWHFNALDPEDFLRIAVLGLASVLIARLYCYSRRFVAWGMARLLRDPYLRVLAGTALVIVITRLLGTMDYNGVGFSYVATALGGSCAGPAFLWKLVLTVLTLGCGIRGGQIAPNVFIGATFGCAVAPLIGLDPCVGAAVCLVGVLSSVTNCTVAIFLYGCETLCFCPKAGLAFLLVSAFAHVLSSEIGIFREQPTERIRGKLHIW